MTRTVLALRHVPFEDLGLLAPLLDARGYRTTYLDVPVEPVTPEAALRPDLLVVLGGPVGVYEDDAYPFLRAEKEALGARARAGLPPSAYAWGRSSWPRPSGRTSCPPGARRSATRR